jgi:hypothetical protein
MRSGLKRPRDEVENKTSNNKKNENQIQYKNKLKSNPFGLH